MSIFNKLHKYAGEVVWVTFGSLFRTGCVFLGWSFLAHNLGPEQLGVFSFSFATINLVASLSEFGLGVGIVKFVASEDPGSKRANNLLRVGFWIRSIMSVLLAVILIVISKWLAVSVMKNPVLHWPIIFAAFGTVAASLYAYVLSAHQGTHRFKGYGVLSICSGLTLIGGFSLLLITNNLNVELALVVATCAFLFPAIIGLFILKIGVTRFPTADCWQEVRSIMSFSRWVLAGSIIALLILQTDTFLLTRLSTLAEVGKYSVAERLGRFISVISNSILTVVMPKVFKKNDYNELRKMFVGILRWIPLLLGIYCVGFFVCPWVVQLAFGKSYENSVLVFRVLFGAYLLSSITNVISYAGYGLNRPDIVSFNLLIQLFVLLIAGYVCIPLFGSVGMADAVIVSRFVGFTFLLLYIWRALGIKYAIFDSQ